MKYKKVGPHLIIWEDKKQPELILRLPNWWDTLSIKERRRLARKLDLKELLLFKGIGLTKSWKELPEKARKKIKSYFVKLATFLKLHGKLEA